MSDNTAQKAIDEFKKLVTDMDRHDAENEKPHEKALRASAGYFQTMLGENINTWSVETGLFPVLFDNNGHFDENDKTRNILYDLVKINDGDSNFRLNKKEMHPVMEKLALLVRQRNEINEIMKEKKLDHEMAAGLIMFGSQKDYMDYFFKAERLSDIEKLLNKKL